MAESRFERVQRFYRQFSEFARDESPLYSALSARIAEDGNLIELTMEADERQPPANMLFASVHYLLLGGDDHPLRAHYPSVAGDEPAGGDLWALFVDFVITRRDQIVPLLRERRVQTNEVRRAALLLPGFAAVAQRTGRPLATLEVGTAAGLLTLWDRYAYEYGPFRLDPAGATLELACDARGGMPSFELPAKAWAAGIDVDPVDVTDEHEARWLMSLVWPDQVERMGRLAAAIEVAQAHPPQLVSGDGIDELPQFASDAPEGATLVIHHSFALNQVAPERRDAFEQALVELSAEREVWLVAIEWEPGRPPDDTFRLRLGAVTGGAVERESLARVHHHGEWLEWVS